ncbi:hypothetical protein [Almyronema epifaneia]|uniref:Roadblock/LC7 domain-containing protein n=1 Tax=Almyronema epifaneia S1 TaxID=2991925 RepID=A0ABW6I9G5_9CYAN
MKRQVIQDFLNLPGIAGVALMDGRSRPYFCGVDQNLNFQQREALAQGIQQVVETTPADLESFAFQFASCQVYIYKLSQGLILMVLTRERLAARPYYAAIAELKASLQQDLSNAVATFKLFAGAAHLSPTDNSETSVAAKPSPPLPPIAQAATGSEPRSASTQAEPPPVPTASAQSAAAVEKPPLAAEAVEPTAVAKKPALPRSAAPTQAELLTALNQLSEFSARYLGKIVVANALRSSRPQDIDWLQLFEIDRKGAITLKIDKNLNSRLSQEQSIWVQRWASAFAEKCTKIIRNYPQLLEEETFDPKCYWLLFKSASQPE